MDWGEHEEHEDRDHYCLYHFAAHFGITHTVCIHPFLCESQSQNEGKIIMKLQMIKEEDRYMLMMGLQSLLSTKSVKERSHRKEQMELCRDATLDSLKLHPEQSNFTHSQKEGEKLFGVVSKRLPRSIWTEHSKRLLMLYILLRLCKCIIDARTSIDSVISSSRDFFLFMPYEQSRNERTCKLLNLMHQ